MKRLITLISLFVFFHPLVSAQVGIGTEAPDSSAALEIESTDRGLLIPRMSSTARQNIAEPAVGLMVFDSTSNAFYYFTGNGWLELIAGKVDQVTDSDGDTKIQVEEGPDEDIIRFDMGGTEYFRMDSGRIEVVNTGNSIFIGNKAGKLDDRADNENVFIGESAGEKNSDGYDLVAIGFQALQEDSNAYHTVAIGANALQNATSTSNIGIGSHTLRNSTGCCNVGIGLFAMEYNTTGAFNVAIGGSALIDQETGIHNVAAGYSALKAKETGDNNIGIGSFAGFEMEGGNDNILIGFNAGQGYSTHSKSNNVMVGSYAGAENEGDGNLFLGYHAGEFETGSNKLYISNSDTVAPLVYGEFDSEFVRINGGLRVSDNVGIGTNTPDASAVLEIQSPDRGILIPRMSATARQAISSPAEGLMVFDSTNNAFYYFSGNGWLELLSGSMDKIADADGDTKIQVEESTDEDVIRFDLSGSERFVFDGPHIYVMGSKSTFLGYDAGLNDDLTNNDNVFVGYRTGSENVSGTNNVAVGSDAMRMNTASFNTALGWSAMNKVTSGNNSTAVGSSSLRDNVDGSNNVAIGSQALVTNANGSHNVAIGARSGHQNAGSGNVFIGREAGYNEVGSNKLYIDNSPTAAPLVYGDFHSNLLSVNGTLNINNAYSLPTTDGTQGQVLRTDGSGNVSWTHAVPVGTIIMWPSASIPGGWVLCNGQDISAYTQLASVLGSNNAPDLRGLFPQGADTNGDLNSTGGQNSVVLSTDNLPSHTHASGSLSATTTNPYLTTSGGSSGLKDGSDTNLFLSNEASISGETAPTGSGVAFDITPPYYALHFIIKAE